MRFHVAGQRQKRNDQREELENGGHDGKYEKHDVKKHKGVLGSEIENQFLKLQYCLIREINVDTLNALGSSDI
jgi:hypothetical protein